MSSRFVKSILLTWIIEKRDPKSVAAIRKKELQNLRTLFFGSAGE
jgi:hypothetical protein